MNNVVHERAQQRFVIALDDGAQAVLEYRLLPDGGVDFNRTYVPFAGRGKGLAEALVSAGLEWARAQNLPIQASCWDVRDRL